MVLRVTRRNLLLLLFMLSVVGLLVYSKIGSSVNLVKGTALSSGLRKLDNLIHKDELGGKQGEWKSKGVGILPGDDDVHEDDVVGVIRFPHESANEGDDDGDDDGVADDGDDSLVRDGSNGSEKGKAMVLIGNHMRVGGNLEKLMKEEGFIRGVDAAGERRGKWIKEKRVDGDGVDREVMVHRRVPVKASGRESVGNDTKELSSRRDANTQVMVINEQARSKAERVANRRTIKVGQSRNHLVADPQPESKKNESLESNSVVATAQGVQHTHYFYEHPEDTKAKKLFMKCLSKMAPTEKKAFIEFESKYDRKESLLRDGRLTLGGKWVILSDFMRTLGREQRLPQVINIGAKKSGTTALGWFLTMHPQISHSFGNEVHFFDKTYHKGLGYYKSRMNFAKTNNLVFEKTPRYLVTDSAPEHAQKDLPSDVKFIICIRDPLKRALSDFRHDSTLKVRRAYKMNPRVIQGRTAETEGERFADGAFDKFGNVNTSFDSVRTSSYVKHFRNWLSYFDRDRFLIIDHQQLVDDAFHELIRIEKFLGLTPYFEKRMFYYDQNRRGTCMRRPGNPCPPRSSPGFLPAGQLSGPEARKLRDYFRPLNREFVELVGDNNFTWVNL
ncbi:putative heparan sulfate glucosamine 3-O-sulfotransferase 1-like [Apostichopus japonicus]|uniref:Putative heparan sulfate glucosamine 3-O-sulfotransferase 1-like n=1 Tax=Stichopus japonicus TaxID=307972 RepID=A0A2G8LN84_STIJA|nr:putative heparan sulfate glucosamine 3-O-sulfotransferase 1-like [Apostichopus japonicus]